MIRYQVRSGHIVSFITQAQEEEVKTQTFSIVSLIFFVLFIGLPASSGAGLLRVDDTPKHSYVSNAPDAHCIGLPEKMYPREVFIGLDCRHLHKVPVQNINAKIDGKGDNIIRIWITLSDNRVIFLERIPECMPSFLVMNQVVYGPDIIPTTLPTGRIPYYCVGR